jgi:hypothetical protein
MADLFRPRFDPHQFSKSGIGIEPGSDRGASDCQPVNACKCFANTIECLIDLRYPAGDQLPEC